MAEPEIYSLLGLAVAVFSALGTVFGYLMGRIDGFRKEAKDDRHMFAGQIQTIINKIEDDLVAVRERVTRLERNGH